MDVFKGSIVVIDDVLVLTPFVPTFKKEWFSGKEGVDDRYQALDPATPGERAAQNLKRVSVGAVAAKQLLSKKLLSESVVALEEGSFVLGANVAEALYQAPEKWPESWKVEGFKLAFPATRIEGHYTTERLAAMLWWNRTANHPEFGYIALCDRTPATAAYIAVLEGNALV